MKFKRIAEILQRFTFRLALRSDIHVQTLRDKPVTFLCNNRSDISFHNSQVKHGGRRPYRGHARPKQADDTAHGCAGKPPPATKTTQLS